MSDEELSELIDGFRRIIKEALATTLLSSYTTTALIVDREGSLEFEMLVDSDGEAPDSASEAAYELGKLLGSRRSDIAAVLVAEQLPQYFNALGIVISAGTPEGYRTAVFLPLIQVPDGTLRVNDVLELASVNPVTDLSGSAGRLLIQGVIDAKNTDGDDV